MEETFDSIQPTLGDTSPFRSVCFETDAPASASEQSQFTIGKPDHLNGLMPRERALLPGYDSAVVVLLLALFLFVAVNFKHYSVFLKTFSQELLSVRRRANVFDDHTVSETRILISLVLIVCVSEGILLFSRIYNSDTSHAVFPLLLALIGFTLLYYLVQLVAYITVGNVFTDRTGAEQWVKGFNASQSLLGIVLVIPALMTLFYPGMSNVMFIFGAVFYVVSRIIFICKGFKIFYQNLFSLVYFILYLCALEIAPLLMVYRSRSIITSI